MTFFNNASKYGHRNVPCRIIQSFTEPSQIGPHHEFDEGDLPFHLIEFVEGPLPQLYALDEEVTPDRVYQYTFYEDPGHGWLEVPVADLESVGLRLKDISGYSYHFMNQVYLEEDSDMPRFMQALADKLDVDFKDLRVVDKTWYDDNNYVRRLPRLDMTRRPNLATS